jgi:hypothetical protein
MNARSPLTNRLIAALVLLGLAASSQERQASAVPPLTQDPQQCTWAVVRMPSHGASATVIYTETGRTYLLGCGHAFRGGDRHKPIVLDLPTQETAQAPKKVGIRLLDVDYDSDLSLIVLPDGPVLYVAAVAPPGHSPSRHLLSVGYDGMQFPAQEKPATLLISSPLVTYTRERPWHGRSGGALLDMEHGWLIGVVQGYEVSGGRRGMYVSHAAILRFLSRRPGQGQGGGAAPLPSRPVPFPT